MNKQQKQQATDLFTVAFELPQHRKVIEAVTKAYHMALARGDDPRQVRVFTAGVISGVVDSATDVKLRRNRFYHIVDRLVGETLTTEQAMALFDHDENFMVCSWCSEPAYNHSQGTEDCCGEGGYYWYRPDSALVFAHAFKAYNNYAPSPAYWYRKLFELGMA